MNIWSPCILLLTIYSTTSTLVPNRTGSLSLRRRTLYPIELRGHDIIINDRLALFIYLTFSHSFTNVPLYSFNRGLRIERFFSKRFKVLDSLLDIDAVYPAISVNIIAASFLSI